VELFYSGTLSLRSGFRKIRLVDQTIRKSKGQDVETMIRQFLSARDVNLVASCVGGLDFDHQRLPVRSEGDKIAGARRTQGSKDMVATLQQVDGDSR
jgi:hypothetical protein